MQCGTEMQAHATMQCGTNCQVQSRSRYRSFVNKPFLIGNIEWNT